MQLTCSRCSAEIRAEDVHVELAIAKCASCRAVMDLAAGETVDESGNPVGRARAPVPLPPRFEVDEGAGGLSIHWKWFSLKHWAMLLFCIVWDGFLLFWYATAAKSGLNAMMLSGIMHVAVGVGLTYVTIAGFLNRTLIEARGGLLTIRHFPLPWAGNRELNGREIEQLFCEEHVARTKSGTTVTYRLNAILKPDSRKLKLISGLEDAQQAFFLEQKLEKQLRIQDCPVEGEFQRRQSV